MADDIIEAVWILTFQKCLGAHIVSVGNIQTCTYPAINHCTSKSPQVSILKLASTLWFPETKSSEIFKLRIFPLQNKTQVGWPQFSFMQL